MKEVDREQVAGVSFRPAVADDMPWIAEHVLRFRLDSECLEPEQFIIAEREGRAAGFGRIKPYREVYELGCVAVVEAQRGIGIGARIVRELIRRFPVPEVYITTDLPAYFERFGFERIDPPPAELAAKLGRIEGRVRSGVVAMRLCRQDKDGPFQSR